VAHPGGSESGCNESAPAGASLRLAHPSPSPAPLPLLQKVPTVFLPHCPRYPASHHRSRPEVPIAGRSRWA
jgi:hypothetical protein